METVVVAHDAAGPSAAPRRPRRGRRPHPAGQPDEAAHRVPGPDRERLHEDDRRRLRQAARARPSSTPAVPSSMPRPAARRHRPRCAAPGGCSVAWPRSRRRPATSSPCAALTRRRGRRRRPRSPSPTRPATSSPRCRSRRSTCSSSRRAARTSPARRSIPTSPGRFWVDGLADLPSPKVAMIVLLGLTPVTAGNATGIGFVDFVPGRRWPSRSTGRRRTSTRSPPAARASGAGRMPMVLPDEESCIRAAHADVRPAVRRAEAGRAHPLDAAPDPLLGQRRPARRPACGRARSPPP